MNTHPLNNIEILRIAAAMLIDSKDYPLLLKRRALKECQSLHRLATGGLQPLRGTIISLNHGARHDHL